VEASAFGPPRRYYDITEEGRKALSEWQFAWRDMREFVDDALKAGTIPGATQDGHAGAAA
jgi:PadR family transcriptional regulator PadR